jgi:hypothetical protein
MGFAPTIGVSLAEPSLLGNVLSFCNNNKKKLSPRRQKLPSFIVAGTRGKN